MGRKAGWTKRWRREGATLVNRTSGAREADLCYCRTMPVAIRNLRSPGGAMPLSTYAFLDLTNEQRERWHRHFERENFASRSQHGQGVAEILGLTEHQKQLLEARIATIVAARP